MKYVLYLHARAFGVFPQSTFSAVFSCSHNKSIAHKDVDRYQTSNLLSPPTGKVGLRHNGGCCMGEACQ